MHQLMFAANAKVERKKKPSMLARYVSLIWVTLPAGHTQIYSQ